MRQFETSCGSTITHTIDEAIASAAKHRDHCSFEFNGVTVVVAGCSDRHTIYRDWNRGMNGYLGKSPTVGPYPTPELSPADKASDSAIEAENSRKAKIESEKYRKAAEAKKLLLQGALSVAGPLELSDPAGWQKFAEVNRDGYGSRVVRYAEEWGRMMQTRLANGETVAECADELSHLADDDGITGFMYGCAVTVLAKCWRHGEVLRRWHNKETQLGTEGDKANETGGVLNPALLSIG